MIRRPPRSTLSSSSAASDVYKRQRYHSAIANAACLLYPFFAGLVQSAALCCATQANRLEAAAMSIKPSIAVVEDDDSVREATIGLLRSHGFIAKGFASADAFLKSNRIRITSCLIADVQMPNMSGLV